MITGRYLAGRLRHSAIGSLKRFEKGTFEHILKTFDDLDDRAHLIADDEFARYGSEPADEDWAGDMSDVAEAATEVGLEFYEMMTSLRQSLLNLMAAGLFHFTEQQLAALCHEPGLGVPPPPDGDLKNVVPWYVEHFGISLKSFAAWSNINELQKLANTVKHAEGSSSRALRELRPELFQNPWLAMLRIDSANGRLNSPLAGDGLFVTEELLQGYFRSALSFFETLAATFEADERTTYALVNTV